MLIFLFIDTPSLRLATHTLYEFSYTGYFHYISHCYDVHYRYCHCRYSSTLYCHTLADYAFHWYYATSPLMPSWFRHCIDDAPPLLAIDAFTATLMLAAMPLFAFLSSSHAADRRFLFFFASRYTHYTLAINIVIITGHYYTLIHTLILSLLLTLILHLHNSH